MAARSLRVVSISRTWGIFSRITGSSVSRAAAMHGSAAFFAPPIRMVPNSGLPPRITSLSILETSFLRPPRHEFYGARYGYSSGEHGAAGAKTYWSPEVREPGL